MLTCELRVCAWRGMEWEAYWDSGIVTECGAAGRLNVFIMGIAAGWVRRCSV